MGASHPPKAQLAQMFPALKQVLRQLHWIKRTRSRNLSKKRMTMGGEAFLHLLLLRRPCRLRQMRPSLTQGGLEALPAQECQKMVMRSRPRSPTRNRHWLEARLLTYDHPSYPKT